MRVAVKSRRHLVAIERLLQAAGAKEREDRLGLAFDRHLDRGVMQDRDLLRRLKTRQRLLELERLFDPLVDEALYGVFAPGFERVPAEAAAEAFDAGKADALHLAVVSVEHLDACGDEHFLDLVLFS